MPIAAGLNMQLSYKVETTAGTAPGQSGAQLLRRRSSQVDLNKDTLQSNELRTDLQTADFRHGSRRVGGAVQGDLSVGTYKEWLQWLLKRDFAAVTASTSVSLTIAGAGPTHTVTRAAGSWLSDGYKVGMVVRLSVGSLNAANINKNLWIVDIGSATAMTVIPLNGVAMFAEGPVAGCTITATGKSTYVPTSGHTDKSFSMEHWYPDLGTPASELYLGCKVTKAALSLNPTAMAGVSFDIMGLDVADTTAKRGAVALNTQYFTSPTALSTGGVLSPASGLLRVGGSTVATVTGLSLDIASPYSGDPVVGSVYIPQLFPGRVNVTGQLTAYFDSATLRDAFWNESEIELLAALTTDPASATADFLTIALPRIKLGGAARDDGEGGKVITLPFQALLNTAGGAGIKTEKTTILMQDSLA